MSHDAQTAKNETEPASTSPEQAAQETQEPPSAIEFLSGADMCLALDCRPHDLMNWRRLPTDHPRHLPSVKLESGKIVACYYPLRSTVEWLQRPINFRLRATLAAQFAPEHIQRPFDAEHARDTIEQLRASPASPASPSVQRAGKLVVDTDSEQLRVVEQLRAQSTAQTSQPATEH